MGDCLLSLTRIHLHSVKKSRITLLSRLRAVASETQKAEDAKTSIERESKAVADFSSDLNIEGFEAWLKQARTTVATAELGLQSAINDADSARAEMLSIKATERATLQLKRRRDSARDAIALKQNRNELEELLIQPFLYLKLTL